MSKYIDADIIRNHFKADLSRRPKSFLDDMLMACVNRVIDEAPAADVAEVVRCKDCKHADLFYPYCTIWEAAIDGDGYCYKGEKE